MGLCLAFLLFLYFFVFAPHGTRKQKLQVPGSWWKAAFPLAVYSWPLEIPFCIASSAMPFQWLKKILSGIPSSGRGQGFQMSSAIIQSETEALLAVSIPANSLWAFKAEQGQLGNKCIFMASEPCSENPHLNPFPYHFSKSCCQGRI
jgi:hypothetical protein